MGLSCRSRFHDASVRTRSRSQPLERPTDGLGGVLPLVVAVNCQDVMALFCECRLNEPTGCQGFTRVCPLPILRLHRQVAKAVRQLATLMTMSVSSLIAAIRFVRPKQ